MLDFKDHSKLVETDLGKQKALDSKPKKVQQINFMAKTKGTARNLYVLEKPMPVAKNILIILIWQQQWLVGFKRQQKAAV